MAIFIEENYKEHTMPRRIFQAAFEPKLGPSMARMWGGLLQVSSHLQKVEIG